MGCSPYSSLNLIRSAASSNEWGELKRKIKVKASLIYAKSIMIEYKFEEVFKTCKKLVPSNEIGQLNTQFVFFGHIIEDMYTAY